MNEKTTVLDDVRLAVSLLVRAVMIGAAIWLIYELRHGYNHGVASIPTELKWSKLCQTEALVKERNPESCAHAEDAVGAFYAYEMALTHVGSKIWHGLESLGLFVLIVVFALVFSAILLLGCAQKYDTGGGGAATGKAPRRTLAVLEQAPNEITGTRKAITLRDVD